MRQANERKRRRVLLREDANVQVKGELSFEKRLRMQLSKDLEEGNVLNEANTREIMEFVRLKDMKTVYVYHSNGYIGSTKHGEPQQPCSFPFTTFSSRVTTATPTVTAATASATSMVLAEPQRECSSNEGLLSGTLSRQPPSLAPCSSNEVQLPKPSSSPQPSSSASVPATEADDLVRPQPQAESLNEVVLLSPQPSAFQPVVPAIDATSSEVLLPNPPPPPLSLDAQAGTDDTILSPQGPTPQPSSAVVPASVVNDLTSVTTVATATHGEGWDLVDDVDILVEHAELICFNDGSWHFSKLPPTDRRVQSSVQGSDDSNYLAAFSRDRLIVDVNIINPISLFTYSKGKYQSYIAANFPEDKKSAVVLCPYGYHISKDSINSILYAKTDLRSEIIGFYCKFLNRRLRGISDTAPRIVVAGVEFYTALMQNTYTYDAGKSQLGKSHSILFNDIVDKVIFVCHVDTQVLHYVTVMLDFTGKTIYFFDSARGKYASFTAVMTIFVKFLKEYAEKEKKHFVESEWRKQDCQQIAQQQSGQPSCGVFALLYIECLVRGEKVPKSVIKKDYSFINECRRRIFVTLINNHMF